MKRSRERSVPGLLITICAAVLLTLPATPVLASCESIFCPFGTDACPKDLLEKVQICKAMKAVESGIGAAQDTLEDVEDAAESVGNEFEAIDETFQNIYSEMEKVNNSARIFDQIIGTTSALSNETLEVTENLIQAIEDARKVVQFHLEYQSARYNAFTGPSGCGATCQQFRQELVDLFLNLETAVNLAFDALLAQLPADVRAELTMRPRVDLSQIRALIQHIPGFVLYPLHEAFSATGSTDVSGKASYSRQTASVTSSLNGFLDQVITHLRMGVRSSVEFVNDGGLSLCSQLNGLDPDTKEGWVLAASISSVSGKLLVAFGSYLESWGFETFDKVDKAVAAGVLIKSAFNWRLARAFGKAIKSLAAASILFGDVTLRRFTRCRDQWDQMVTLCVMDANKQKSFTQCRAAIAAGKRFGF
jgi:hypothetical protein